MVAADHGTCVAVDGDGDVWWLTYAGDAKGGRWTVAAGTGKFEGMTGGGTTQNLLATRDGRLTISWEGTLEMR